MARQSIWCTLKSITFRAWYIGEQSLCGLFKNASIRAVSIPTFTVLETTWPKQPKFFQYIDQMSGAFESANVCSSVWHIGHYGEFGKLKLANAKEKRRTAEWSGISHGEKQLLQLLLQFGQLSLFSVSELVSDIMYLCLVLIPKYE